LSEGRHTPPDRSSEVTLFPHLRDFDNIRKKLGNNI